MAASTARELLWPDNKRRSLSKTAFNKAAIRSIR
jgi:hypothetical protein